MTNKCSECANRTHPFWESEKCMGCNQRHRNNWGPKHPPCTVAEDELPGPGMVCADCGLTSCNLCIEQGRPRFGFTRADLQRLRLRATREYSVPHLMDSWKRAYENLANACDVLDAMMCRTEVNKPEEPVK